MINLRKQLLYDFFKKSPLAFSYHRVIRDKLGFPCDYEFLGINDALEALTGLKASTLVGHRYNQLFPASDGDAPGWRDVYQDAIVHRKIVITNRYHRTIEKWLTVTVYAIDDEHCACFYTLAPNPNQPLRFPPNSSDFFVIDHMNGMTSKPAFDKRIDEEIDRSNRYDEPLSLLLLEAVPQSGTNAAGNRDVLLDSMKQTVEICLSLIRKYDVMTRENEFQFTLLMPKTNTKGAMIVTQRILNTLKSQMPPLTESVSTHFAICERISNESYADWQLRASESLESSRKMAPNEIVIADKEIHDASPMKLTWHNDWNSRNYQIDFQHRELVELSNQLLKMMDSGDTVDVMTNLLDRTIDHLVHHFNYEEQLLSRCQYPDLEKFTKIHKNLIGKAFSLKDAFVRGEINPGEYFAFLVADVINGHLLSEDVAFFPNLQAHPDIR